MNGKITNRGSNTLEVEETILDRRDAGVTQVQLLAEEASDVHLGDVVQSDNTVAQLGPQDNRLDLHALAPAFVKAHAADESIQLGGRNLDGSRPVLKFHLFKGQPLVIRGKQVGVRRLERTYIRHLEKQVDNPEITQTTSATTVISTALRRIRNGVIRLFRRIFSVLLLLAVI
jgi:hypothetical protein